MGKNRPYLRSLPTDVYRAYSNDDTLLYVGISSRTLVRLNEHRALSHWFPEAYLFAIESYENQRQARGAEAQAIQQERPLYNMRPEALSERIRANSEAYEPYDAFEITVHDIWPEVGQ